MLARISYHTDALGGRRRVQSLQARGLLKKDFCGTKTTTTQVQPRGQIVDAISIREPRKGSPATPTREPKKKLDGIIAPPGIEAIRGIEAMVEGVLEAVCIVAIRVEAVRRIDVNVDVVE